MAIKTKHVGERLDSVEITPRDQPGELDIRRIEVDTSPNDGVVNIWVWHGESRVPEHAWFSGDDLIAFGAACIELGLNARTADVEKDPADECTLCGFNPCRGDGCP